MWLHSLKVAKLLHSAACLLTNQSRSYLNHLVKFSKLTTRESVLQHEEFHCYDSEIPADLLHRLRGEGKTHKTHNENMESRQAVYIKRNTDGAFE